MNYKNRQKLVLLAFLLPIISFAQTVDFEDFRDECTTITMGKKATHDGSVRTSHTDDSHRTRSNILIVPAANHPKEATVTMYKRLWCDTTKMRSYRNDSIGVIPQVEHTFGYINTAYPCMNEKQLAIGESTIGGRNTLQSDNGLIDCQRLCGLLLQRCSTARQAIATAGDLLKKYGWIDAGECLTIADKNEVWHLEIYGPGKGNKGALWVAQRVPDDHVAVNANASTISLIDTTLHDYFMYSDNLFQLALDSGWWKKGEPFRFCYVYAPHSRTMLACRRREWRVFDLVAPSLHLDPNTELYPFSVKPDSLVSIEKMMSIFRDYYEGTEYDMRKNITVTNDSGKTVISPLANPFMTVDELKLHKVNGGWHQYGERAIAVRFTMYGTVLQCRNWLPDEIGGVAWIALDNVASSVYVPIYCSVTDLPTTYKTCGRQTGFSKDAAWWAFNRLGTLASKRWGSMRHDIDSTWQPFQNEMFTEQPVIEKKALDVYNAKNPTKTIKILTDYTNLYANKAVQKAWDLGDQIWTKYDGMW
ncbi:MAG: C69 family dipeptidase [Bacteroidales bacterium]|jgi:dipeptidase|nr:C69 family dipeptidase [Bacteroidales bacterium]